MAIRVVADSQAARRGGLFHACRDVHRLTSDAVLGIDAAPDEYAAGVHAHTYRKAVVAVLA